MIFSVVLPTYNRRRLLEKCLASIVSQDFPQADYEVIVVDDGSLDGTPDFLKSFVAPNFRLILQSHGGPAKARNAGSRKALGTFLAFTDDDCSVPRGWLTTLFTGFSQWSQVAAVGGFLEAPAEVLERNNLAKLESWETHQIYGASHQSSLGGFESPAGGTNNIAYRREIFLNLGGFDEHFPGPAGEDADLKWRAIKAGFHIGYLPIKVMHLDPYNFSSFWRRSIASGLGSSFFREKNLNQKESLKSIVKDFLKVFLRFWLVLLVPLKVKGTKASRILSSLILMRAMLMDYGRLKYLKSSKSRI